MIAYKGFNKELSCTMGRGTYQYQVSDPVNKHWFDNEVLFEFDDAQQLWSEFTLNGHNLKYVIEHSVVDIMH